VNRTLISESLGRFNSHSTRNINFLRVEIIFYPSCALYHLRPEGFLQILVEEGASCKDLSGKASAYLQEDAKHVMSA
jgi:hypothetical protein